MVPNARLNETTSSSHLVLVVVVIPQSLAVLVQFAHEHLPRAEVEGAEVHLVTKVTRQLGLASKLLPRWTDREADQRTRYYCYHLIQTGIKKPRDKDGGPKQTHTRAQSLTHVHTHTRTTTCNKSEAVHIQIADDTQKSHIVKWMQYLMNAPLLPRFQAAHIPHAEDTFMSSEPSTPPPPTTHRRGQ